MAIALHRPRVEVFATDSSPAAVALARENARRHGVSGRVHVVHGDLLAGVPGPLDLVVANLPYLPPCRAADFPTEPVTAVVVDGGRARPLPPPARAGHAAAAAGSAAARAAPRRGSRPRTTARGLDSAAWAGSCARSSSSTVSGPRSAAPAPKGVFWRTRADDMAVKAVRELLRRNPSLPPERIGDVIIAATAQVGDQGLTLGRDVALLAGLPQTVPGFALDRMCAGALTAIDGRRGRDRDGRGRRRDRRRRRAHGPPPDGRGGRLQPALRRRAARRHVRGHDGLDRREPPRPLPAPDEGGRRRFRRALAAARGGGLGERRDARDRRPDVASSATRAGGVADRDEFLRPDTSMEGLATLPTPFRAGGRVTAGNSAGLTDGATAAPPRLGGDGRRARPRRRRCGSSASRSRASSRS